MSHKQSNWRAALEALVDEKRRDLEDHPSLDGLVDYYAENLSAADTARMQDHLVFCPECASLLLELDTFAQPVDIESEEPTPQPATPQPATPQPATPQLATPQPATPPPAVVIPKKQHRPRWRRRWAVALATAAAALLAIWPRGEPLPDYTLRFDGELQRIRTPSTDPEKEIPIFAVGSRLRIQLQPQTAVAGPLTARSFERRGDELLPLSTSTLVLREDGVISLEGILGAEVHLGEGETELVFAVARQSRLPPLSRLAKALASGRPPRGRQWIGLRQKIRIEGPSGSAPDRRAVHEPWVEFAGCQTILTGPLCVLPNDRRLTLWLAHRPNTDVRIEAGGFRKPTNPAAVQEGTRYEIEVAAGIRELVVETRHQGEQRVWALALAAPATPPWLAAARAQMDRGELDAARGRLNSLLPTLDPTERGKALGLLARIERRRGQPARIDALYEGALKAHREAGDLFGEVDDATAWTYQLIEQKRFPEARRLLDSLPVEALGGSSHARYLVAYYRSLLAKDTGDLRAAMNWMARAVRAAERAGMVREQIFSEDLLALTLQSAGLFGEATALYSRVRSKVEAQCSGRSGDAVLNPCDCARLVGNRAWAWLQAREAGLPADDPLPFLLKAEQILLNDLADGGETCAFPGDLPNVRLNLAWAALSAQGTAQARRYVEQAMVDAENFPRLALWQLEIEARILATDARYDRVLELYEELGQRAALGSSPEAHWRAAFGRATALEALGRAGEALVACAEAEDLLDQESLLVPMHEGRANFIAQRGHASKFCLDLLLRADQVQEALAVARRSAARALRGLRVGARIAELGGEERLLFERTVSSYQVARAALEEMTARIEKGLPRDEEEQLGHDLENTRQELRRQLDRLFALLGGRSALAHRDLAPPAPGTVLLAYHPLPTGWAAFAADAAGVSVRRIELPAALLEAPPEGAELSALLLEPFAGKIARAAEVQVIPFGPLRDVDFHALPAGDDLLLHHAPVVYRLDLPDRPAAESTPAPRALVVAPPGLREAPAEARRVRQALEAQATPWRVDLLAGEAAHETDVRRRLVDMELLHYAGHADFDEDSRGWDSHLAMAGAGRLTVDDILASPRVPPWVVLSGCETGLDSRSASLPSIGLAQAFLVAGSRAVVAATAEVSDQDAAALAEALYRHWRAETPLHVALREAQLELEDQVPDSAWQKFRVLAR